MIEIVVYGQPAPQGSKKFLGTKGGHGIMVEQSKQAKPWREAVKYAARDALGSNPSIAGPVCAEMTFTMRKPKSAPKKRRTWPDRTPDLSKLVRATEDALTDAGVWEDDARVVRCLARKVFPGEGTDALNSPGAVIRLFAMDECINQLWPGSSLRCVLSL